MAAFRYTIALLAASAVFAQSDSRTFHLTTVSTPTGLNELATLLRTVGEIPQVHTDATTFDITVSGGDLDLAAWMVKQLDTTTMQPAQYGTSDGQVVSILLTANSTMPAMLNEMVTTLRTVADIQRIFTSSARHAIALRTSPARAELAAWMVKQLDIAPDDQSRWQPHQVAAADIPGEVVKVDYLIHAPPTNFGLNEVVTVLRAVGDMQRIFTRSSPPGVAFRGTPAQVQLADWLFQQMDVQPDAQMRADKHELALQDSENQVARVYYLKSADLNATATALRAQAGIQHLFVCTQPKAVAIRATPETADAADRVIKELDQ